MAIYVDSDGRGGSVYTDSDTGRKLSRSEYLQRQQQDSGGFFNKIENTISDAVDWLNKTPAQRGVDPTQLSSLYLANSQMKTDADKAARLNEAGNILGMNDAQKSLTTQAGLHNDDILLAAEERAKQMQDTPTDWGKFVQDNPATSNYLSEQKNMAQSWDDLNPLSNVEKYWTSIKDHATMADLEEKRAQMGMMMEHDGLSINDLSASQRTDLENIQNQINTLSSKYGDSWALSNIVGGIAGMKNDVESGLIAGLGGAATGAAIGAAGAGIGAIPGAISGFGYGLRGGMAYSMAHRAMGNAYLDSLEKESQNGQTMTPGSAKWSAYISGAANAVLGTVGIGKLVSKLPSGDMVFNVFKKTMPEEVLANPVAANSAWKLFAKNLTISTAEQSAVFGGLTKAADIAAQRTAESLSGLDYDHSGEPTALDQILKSTVDFVPTAALMGGTVGLVKLPFDIQAQKRSALEESLTKTADAINESKTSKRSPEAIADLVNTISKDSPAENLYIPADEAVRLFQEKMPDDENAMADVMQKAGVDPKDLQEAVTTGSDIAIKSGDFFKAFSNVPYFKDLVKSVKTHPSDFTQAELDKATEDFMNQAQAASDAAEGKDVDVKSPAYSEAMRIVKQAYPDITNEKALEKQANLIYAMAKQAENRGVFDVLGLKDAEAGLKNIDIRRMESPPDNETFALNQYAGESAESADHLGLSQAKELADKGTDNETIRKQAGWFQGMDKKWRFEIDDSKAKYKNPEDIAAPLNEVLDHPNLYKAYPELKDVSVVVAPLGKDISGAYDKNTNEIVLNENIPDKEKRETLLHEVQHAIQHQEGFANGGSPNTEISESRKLGEAGYEKLAGEIEARDSENRAALSDNQRKSTPPDLQSDAIVMHNGKESAYSIKANASYIPDGTVKGIIELYKTANYSSLSHEMMHHFMNLHKLAAESGKASDEIMQDYKILQDFVGNKGDAWTREQDEKVARAFEQYLANGKAPSLELVGVFDRFKAWMKRIYVKLKSSGFEINGDVSAVFDRMLATDEQIQQAEMFYGTERLMGGKEMGLSSLKQYVGTLKKAHEKAESILYKKAMADLQPEFKKRLEDFSEKARQEESKKMRTEEPVYMALEAMRFDKDIPEENPGKSFVDMDKKSLKLNRKATVEQYGKKAVPNDLMAKDGNYTLDDIAELYGFQSGDELRQAIANNKPFGAELNRRISQRIAEFKQQEIGNMHDEAIKAVHNNYSLEAVAIESEAIKKAMSDMADKNKQGLMKDWLSAKDQHKQDLKADAKLDAANQKIDDLKESRRWSQAVSQGKLKAAAARQAATRIIENKAIGESHNWKKYIQQSVKSGKESSRQLAKGNYEEALQQKDREILNHALAMAAAKAEKEINSNLKYLQSFDKRGNNMKGLPFEFNRQIDELLSKYNLLTREPLRAIEGQPTLTLRDFVKDCENNYFTPQVPDSILDGQPIHYSRLNLNELRDVKAAVKSLQHVGKIMDRAVSDDRKETMTERKSMIIDKLGEHFQRYEKDESAGKPSLNIVEKLGRIPDKFNTSLVKMESFCRVIDKGEHGPATTYILDPIYKALGNYQKREHIVMDKFNNLVKDAGFTPKEIAKLQKEKVHFDFLTNDLTKAEIVQMALNWGNDGNRDRLRSYFLNDHQKGRKLEDAERNDVDTKVAQVFNTLDEKHWKLVQNIWDYLETYTPEVRQHEISLSGVDPKMVDAKPFDIYTKDGQQIHLEGGYYPIAYDPEKSSAASKHQEELSALYVSNPATRAMTRHGHTESRVQTYRKPLLLDWSVLTNHLRNVNYDLAMRKPIIDVNRILNDDGVTRAISDVFGVKTHGEMLNWLRYVASDQSETMRGGESIARNLRRNTTKAALGFRLKAMFEDLPVNVVQSFWQMGIGDTIKGMTEFYTGNWKEQKAFVDGKSSMMSERLSFLDRDIGEFSKTMFENSGLTAKAEKFIYFMDSMADAAVVYPMWQKMYSKAIAKGIAETDAIQEADGYIRRTTADGSRAGLVNMQRGTEYSKLATMFYTWYSGLFNRFWTATKTSQYQWADGEKVAAAHTMLRAGLYGWMIPGIMAGAVKVAFSNSQTNDADKKKKKNILNFVSGFATQPMGIAPVIGGLASYGVNKSLGIYDSFSISPIEGTAEKMVDAVPAVYKYLSEPASSTNTGAKAGLAVADAAAYGAFQWAGLPAYPTRVNTWAYNFIDWLNGHGDLTVSDFITRRHKLK